MTPRAAVDKLAKTVMLADANDPFALTELLMAFDDLSKELTKEHPHVIQDCCQDATGTLKELVKGEGDAEGELAFMQEVVTFVQEVLDLMETGGDWKSLSEPKRKEKVQAEDIDLELLEMFLSSCQEGLANLEEEVLNLEKQDDGNDTLDSIRRTVHTIKGECGVLSLYSTQELCHEAESMIDVYTECGKTVPTDAILELVDWLRRRMVQLAADPTTEPADGADLLEKFRRLQSSDAVASAPQVGAPAAAAAPAADEASPRPGEGAEPSSDEFTPPFGIADRTVFSESILEDETLVDFLGESRHHLEASEAALLELEHACEDETNELDEKEMVELVDGVFRAFHTIKGVAGYMQITEVVELAHETETLMDLFRKGQMKCQPAHVDLILTSCDLMTQMLDCLEGRDGPPKNDLAHQNFRLTRASEGKPFSSKQHSVSDLSVETICDELMLETEDDVKKALRERGETRYRFGQFLIAASAISVPGLEKALEKQAASGCLLGDAIVALGLATQADVDDALAKQAAEDQRLATLLGMSAADMLEAVRSDAKGSPAQPAMKSTPTASTGGPAPVQNVIPPSEPKSVKRAADSSAPNPKDKAPAQRSEKKRLKIDAAIKVSTARLDNMVDMVGELVIAQQMIVQDSNVLAITSEGLTRNLALVNKITRDLQEASMSLRMVTVKSTFQKMARLVRDVAARANKKVNLTLSGEDTELDRNVVEKISDPLVHLVRNAVDHGIEAPDARIANGKLPAGSLSLSAYHQGGAIVIEIKDDGAGMSRERILKRAYERGILAPDVKPESVSDQEVFKMIFLPGFSTAEKVTDISGRGVGMDVVRRNIEAMRGRVEISSRAGKGSTMTLRLPLTLAIIDGMVIRVGAQRYILPTLAIEHSFRPQPDQFNSVLGGAGQVVKVRGELLPVHWLKDVFSIHSDDQDSSDTTAIIIEANDKKTCLVVEEILGQQQVVIKSLGKSMKKITGVSGGAILGDGRVALILDVDELVAEAARKVATQVA